MQTGMLFAVCAWQVFYLKRYVSFPFPCLPLLTSWLTRFFEHKRVV